MRISDWSSDVCSSDLVSKAGTNDLTVGLHLNWEPDGLASTSPDTYRDRNRSDKRDSFSAIAEAGGPIIKDRLFAYGLVQLRDITSEESRILDGARYIDRDTDPIWALKVDDRMRTRLNSSH